MNSPYGIAVDDAGNVFFADYVNNKIRFVNSTSGIITTYAGTGIAGNTGDGGAASAALLNSPRGLAYSSGVLYIADAGNSKVRVVDVVSGIISLYAGTGVPGSTGNGGQATSARLLSPTAFTVDGQGNNNPLSLSSLVPHIAPVHPSFYASSPFFSRQRLHRR